MARRRGVLGRLPRSDGPGADRARTARSTARRCAAWIHVLSFTERDALATHFVAKAEIRSPAWTSTALLDWYERVRRPLPWRATRDPYALLVSRGDAPADPGAAGRAVLRALAGRGSRTRRAGGGAGARRARAVERAGLQPARAGAAERGARGRRARLARRPDRAAGRGAVHGGGGVVVRVGSRRSPRWTRTCGGCSSRRDGVVRAPRELRRARPQLLPRGPGGDVQPGDDGARRDGLPPARARVRGVPGRARLPRPRRQSRRVAASRRCASRTPTAGRAGASSRRCWRARSSPVQGERLRARARRASSATAWSSAAPTAGAPALTCAARASLS